MQNITVRNNQNLLDLALQSTGSADTVFNLASVNELGITDDLIAGVSLVKIDVADERIVEQYAAGRIIPATGIVVEQVLEGIDYWAISIDFKIS